ncbi:MAG: CDP-alcohol phosphatidyltransferase family protein [Mogibacterium sp.]|nr:CDP-alcohol phosphatidyltransferase family protein [Mogibacterium sp.]
MANIITVIRIICSIVLLFCQFPSTAFYILYVIAGITDMIDGAVARKTNTVSEFGAKLDTAADFVFVVVCLIKLIPILDIPKWLFVWIAVIALVKVINIVSGYVMRKEFVAAHTIMNKVTGILLFILPLTLQALELKYTGAAVCTVATFAAVQEGYYIRTRKV